MAEHFNPPSPTANSSAFFIDTAQMSTGHTVTYVGVESRFDKLDRLPGDWRDQLEGVIQNVDLVMPEYCIPALERGAYKVPILGRIAMSYGEDFFEVYKTASELAAKHEKDMAAVDPANNLTYMLYEATSPLTALVSAIAEIRGNQGAHANIIDTIEHILPTGADSRRMVSAEGLRQEAMRRPDSHIAYIAAPAHIKRIRDYTSRSWGVLDVLRWAHYKYAMPGLDRHVHTFQPLPDRRGWQYTGRTPIK
jgi:hypothetical protein